MDIIDKYVYAVTNNIPRNQRKKAEKELRALIDNKIKQEQTQKLESYEQKVLLELGAPEILASKYNPTNNYEESSEDNVWDLSKLPKLPDKKALISPVRCITSMIFSASFILPLYFSPQLFCAYIPTLTGLNTIPIFDGTIFMKYSFMLLLVLILSISKEIVKLRARWWSLEVSALFSIFSALSTIFTIAIFSNPSVWNPNFSQQLMEYTGVGFDLTKLSPIIVESILVLGILEVVFALYKGVKYNKAK